MFQLGMANLLLTHFSLASVSIAYTPIINNMVSYFFG